ncbi:amphoterin-induced protein 1 isoform X2 [Eurytemora carolleeae]|uniref:amphoterin-induced protein 1 isoform X2 n=1 Tax=Eurytemora carolleeae TaxID=1294199 RepID=UPI000C767B27|nr:amphoterin-induced protein 1 isoform X2 [Eurytemora carolleeae]|eukprot:XP_023344085.1 amphoterin-induced protein 1-like isoform X2 [Eurytemora affinis]
MKILILGVICINIICQIKGDADPVWSSKTDGIAHSCDSSWKKQLGFTCSCSKPAVDCKRMNISNIEDLDIPDETTNLDLSFNNLSSLLDDLTGFPFPVEELFLSHNNLETLSNLTFYNFPLLKFLDLSHNKLKAFSPAVFPVINSIQR